MYERDWTERRLANHASGQCVAHLFSDRHTPRASQLHDEIVRMLTIGDLQIVKSLTHLKNLGVARFADGERFGREASRERQSTERQPLHSHRHEPILGIELRLAPSATLPVERRKRDTVESQAPVAWGAVHVFLRGGRLV